MAMFIGTPMRRAWDSAAARAVRAPERVRLGVDLVAIADIEVSFEAGVWN